MNTSTCLTDIDGKPVMDLENCNTDVNNLYQIYYDNALHLMDTDTGKCLKNVYSQKTSFFQTVPLMIHKNGSFL